HDAARPAYLPAAIAGAKGRWRPAVSVIIPFYNAHEHVDETLASLRRQTIFGDMEVIVIDDGSDDPDSLAKLDELRRLDWLRVVRIAHAGLPAARNAGAREARSEYLYYLDADDFIDPTTLEKLVLLLATHPRADFAYNGVVHFGDIEGVGINRFDPERLKRENFIVFSSLIRKETYFRLGGMDEALIDNYEDYDFWLRLLEEGGHGVLLPEPLFHYRRHIKSNRNVLIKQRDERRMLADLRARHPALYGKSETVDRGGWRLLRATPAPHERLRREAGLAALSELPADLPVRGYRRPNLPNPFSPLRWEGEERRILYLLPYFTIGGAEQVDLAILAGLKERGWRITLAACEEHHHPWKERFLAMSEDHFLLPSFGRDEERRLQVLEYLMISRNADVLFIRNAAVGYKLARRLREVTRQVAAVDLLHLHNFGRDWVGFSAPYHDALDRRFVITEDLLRHAVDTYGLSPERFRVIYNGVDFTTPPAHPAAARIAALRAAGAQLVGFCGRFDAEGQKDPLRWLETAARIHAVKPHARFVMIGDGPRLATAKKRAARLGIAGAVTFTGYVDDPRPLLAELDVLMLTSRYEGLPMVVLEALAQGVRVVATDAGGTREALLDGEMGAIVPLDAAPEVIADAAGVVLDRAAQRRLFDPRLRRAVKSRFDLQRQKKAYADNLEELVLGLDHRRRLDDYQLRVMQRAIVP
ncbi:MAG TPA: glycosyltransferase, partial [Thermopetrobacter sp.]|nr:glycosyltransferase [Thermopetrobacter sp.]